MDILSFIIILDKKEILFILEPYLKEIKSEQLIGLIKILYNEHNDNRYFNYIMEIPYLKEKFTHDVLVDSFDRLSFEMCLSFLNVMIVNDYNITNHNQVFDWLDSSDYLKTSKVLNLLCNKTNFFKYYKMTDYETSKNPYVRNLNMKAKLYRF
jgi:hypothetical protein